MLLLRIDGGQNVDIPEALFPRPLEKVKAQRVRCALRIMIFS
ncbi:hypothetical protein V6R21_08445 [Limibacter armeniacum]